MVELQSEFSSARLKQKYDEERAKRLRSGARTYRDVSGELRHYLDDPFVESRLERVPLQEAVDVLIVGGGMCGVLIASRLKMSGVDDVRIVDTAADFGGNWYWNRYPGAACDTEAYVYMPLLEETGYVPTEKYAKAPEILEHFQRIGRKYRLYDRACFQTKVESLRWDERDERWIVDTDRGDTFRARFVCLCLGGQTRPKLPGIPGIETFAGRSFHTSRWDYRYTGIDALGRLTKLQDKRVAIIGTGATAVQAIPHLAAPCPHLQDR